MSKAQTILAIMIVGLAIYFGHAVDNLATQIGQMQHAHLKQADQ